MIEPHPIEPHPIEPHAKAPRRSVVAAAMALGIGMGGFVDGILFHQILQIHSMMSARLPIRDLPPDRLAVNLEVNMFWDGMFHALTWTTTSIGIAMLWTLCRRGTDQPHRTFIGGLLAGWGTFNLVEGTIDHHILHLHHVVEWPGHLTWDLTFLASGAVLLGLGIALIDSGKRMAKTARALQTGA